MKFWTKDRQGGSVTVILTMVLVPMVVVAGLFVDGGRGHLGRSVVRSAEQLVLNDVLAQHDEELRTLFGLLAVIEDEGLSSSANELLQSSLRPDGDGGDILQVIAADGATVTPVANAHLGQSKVLANQIVEFMKYRAPAQFMGDLLESLNWLKTLETGIAMVRARIAYLNKVADVIEEASKLVEELQAIEASLQTLIDKIDALVGLLNNPDNNIVTIYTDAFELVLREHAGEDVSRAEIEAVDAGLARVNSTLTGLGTAADDFYTKASSFDPSALLEKIEALRGPGGAKEQLDGAISDHAANAGGGPGAQPDDAVAAQSELDQSESLMDTIKEAIDTFSTDLMTSLDGRVDDFITDMKAAVALEIPNFATINSYATFKNFGRNYLEDSFSSVLEDVENGVDGAIAGVIEDIKRELDAALKTVRDEVVSQLQDYVKDEVKAALDALKNDLKGLFADEAAAASGGDMLKKLFSLLKDKFGAYQDLVSDLTSQKASPYLEGDSAMGSERPSAGAVLTEGDDAGDFGAVEDKDALASEADSVLAGVVSLLGKLGQILENLRDAVLITEYITGVMTYSTVEYDDEGAAVAEPQRITQNAFADCWNETCAAEAEYVLTGVNGAQGAYGLVFLVRLASNVVTAFRDPVVTRARALISLIPVVGSALAFAVPVVAALIQSADDMAKLHAGEGVPLYSARLAVFETPEFDEIVAPIPGGVEQPDTFEDGPALTYKNYLEIFLIVTTFVNQEAVVMRAADIVQFNKGYLGDEGFRLSQAHTAFTVSAEYEMRPLVSNFFDYDAGGALFSGDNAKRRLTTVGGF